MPTVSVKWRHEVFSNIEIDIRQSPFFLKSQLYILTHVPQGKQKIIFKGTLIEDDTDWSTLGIIDGQKLMMIGTADEIVKAPEEQQVVNVDHNAGLYDLGCTSYINSTLQCLHCVPELKSALLSYRNACRPNGVDLSSHLLTIATRDLFKKLDVNANPVDPSLFILALHMKFPLYVLVNHGLLMLHYAELFWKDMMETLCKSLGSSSGSSSSDSAAVVKTLCGIDFFGCIRYPERQEMYLTKDPAYLLQWIISSEVNHLDQFLKFGLKSEYWEQNSLVYSEELWICELPKYLTIHFMRFVLLESNHIGWYCQKVDCPLELDVYEYCTPGLKLQLQKLRQAENVDLNPDGKNNDCKDAGTNVSACEETSSDEVKNIDMPSNKSQVTGMYDLVAVLTHRGTYSHHVAFVKQETGNWIEYNDHIITTRSKQYITELAGGGFSDHIVYICLYKARQL